MRAIKSLFGSKPKTLRDDPVSPAERIRQSRGRSSDKEMPSMAVRFPSAPGFVAGGFSNEHIADRHRSCSSTSSPENTSVAYLHPAYRASTGMEDQRHVIGSDIVRDTWKVGEDGSEDREREGLSNLMLGVLDKDADQRVHRRGADPKRHGADLRHGEAGDSQARHGAEQGYEPQMRDEMQHADRQSRHQNERDKGMDSDLSDIESNSYTRDEREGEFDGRRTSHDPSHAYSVATSQHSRSVQGTLYSAAPVHSRRQDHTKGCRTSKDPAPEVESLPFPFPLPLPLPRTYPSVIASRCSMLDDSGNRPSQCSCARSTCSQLTARAAGTSTGHAQVAPLACRKHCVEERGEPSSSGPFPWAMVVVVVVPSFWVC